MNSFFGILMEMEAISIWFTLSIPVKLFCIIRDRGPMGCRELAGSEPGAVGEEEREGKDDCVGPARHNSP